MKDRNKKIIISVVGLLLLVLITVGVTYAVFSYTKLGTTENTVTAGTLKFLYTENTGVGAGIKLENALPVADSVGKSYSTEGKVFDFSIEATNTGTEPIPYEITLRKKTGSTLVEEAVKVYLTDMTEDVDSEILKPTLYSDLAQTNIEVGEEIEKTIHTDSVAGGELTYLKDYRLRMWVEESINFAQGDYNEKTFTAMVNVYSNVPLVSEEEINNRNNTNISSVTAGDTKFKAVENQSYQYEALLPKDTTETTISVEAENPNATVMIEKINSPSETAYNSSSSIQKVALTEKVSLSPGENYFKVTILSQNKKIEKSYVVRIFVKTTLEADDLSSILEDDKLVSGVYTFEVNNQEISAHVIVFDGDQTWDKNQTFGDANDVATASIYAQNMVVVKVNGDLTINSGVKVTAYGNMYGGPKGLTLYVTGKLINNGEISMSARGAKAVGQNVYLWKNADGSFQYIPATGGTGGAKRAATATYIQGASGNPGSGRATGGGGAGSVRSNSGTAYNGRGGNGTSYSGGTGGGGLELSSSGGKFNATDGSDVGGAGGNGMTNSGSAAHAGGGAGNPGGYCSKGHANMDHRSNLNGTGGLLIIYANEFKNNGSLTSVGTNIDNGKGEYSGGASGGGSINIFIKGSLGVTDSSTVVNTKYTEILGKTAVTGGRVTRNDQYSGGHGGSGTVSIGAIRNGKYYDLKSAIQLDIDNL